MHPPCLAIVRRIAVDTLDVPQSRLLSATTLEDAGIDSLAATDLVFAVEGHFGITISPGDLPCLRTLGDLAACVDRLIAAEVYSDAE